LQRLNFTMRYVWSLPFFCFLAGYAILYWCVSPAVVAVPQVVGMRLVDAVTTLSNQGLSLFIVRTREVAELKEGTVLEQYPHQGAQVRPGQRIGVVCSIHVPLPVAADYGGMSTQDLEEYARTGGIKIRLHLIPRDTGQSGTCFAQYPLPGTPITDGVVHAYIASCSVPYKVMPSFIGKTVDSACTVALLHTYEVELFEQHAAGKMRPLDRTGDMATYTIVAHIPKPGTIVSERSPWKWYLYATKAQ
jgi:beta-lactam-binding protein with PASTA domain